MQPRLLRSCRRLFGVPEAQRLRFKITHRGYPSTLTCFMRWESTNATNLIQKPDDNFPPTATAPVAQPGINFQQEIQKVRDYAEYLRNHPTSQIAADGYKPENWRDLDWRTALAVLEECISQRIPMSPSYSGIVMGTLARAGQIEHAEALFEAIIARRGGMRLNINHVRSLLKYYTSRRMQTDASRIFDVAQAFLHDPKGTIWLYYYMMKMYADIEDYDRFENMFVHVRDFPEERELQLCHQILLDTFAKRTNTAAVLKIYSQMKESGLVPQGAVMQRLFHALELNRAGETAWEIYTRDFMPVCSKLYDFKTWQAVTRSLILSDASLLKRLIQITPMSQCYRLLWLVNPATQDAENLIEKIIEYEGLNGPSRKRIFKAAVSRAAVLQDWTTVVQCYEAVDGGDSKLFPLYIRGLLEVGRSDEVVALYESNEGRSKFSDPEATKVLLSVFQQRKDRDGVASVVEMMLQRLGQGRGISLRLFESAVDLFMQLCHIEDIEALWKRLLVHHTDRISPAIYLSVSLGHLRCGNITLACRFFVDALNSSTRFTLLRTDVANAFAQFCTARVFRKQPQMDRILSNGRPLHISTDVAHEILSRLSRDLDSHGVFIRANARLPTPFSMTAPVLKALFKEQRSDSFKPS
jgi:pentatricopeptide repeat protein